MKIENGVITAEATVTQQQLSQEEGKVLVRLNLQLPLRGEFRIPMSVEEAKEVPLGTVLQLTIRKPE